MLINGWREFAWWPFYTDICVSRDLRVWRIFQWWLLVCGHAQPFARDLATEGGGHTSPLVLSILIGCVYDHHSQALSLDRC